MAVSVSVIITCNQALCGHFATHALMDMGDVECEPVGRNRKSDCEKTRDYIEMFHGAQDMHQAGVSLASLDLSEVRSYARTLGWSTPPGPYDDDPGEADFCPIHAASAKTVTE